jgi:putative Holliday junction resolvase
MKILALDIGDVWTGTAISDPMGILAKPYKTIKTCDILDSLNEIFQTEKISTVIIGYPKTMRGTKSEQTKKTLDVSQQLRLLFPVINFVLWDERLSSKRADEMIRGHRSPADKQASHSRAAAFILSSYLEYKRIHIDNKD